MDSKKNSAVRDLTAEEPSKLILFMALPLLVGNIVEQLYDLTDTMVLGRFLGVEALAAAGSVGCLVSFMKSFLGGITCGFSICTGQKMGAKDFAGVRYSLIVSTALSLILSAVTMIIALLFSYTILEMMHTPIDIIDDAHSFLVVMFGGLSISTMMWLLSNMVRVFGNTKLPAKIWMMTLALNIVFDPIAIIVLHLGVKGIAAATILAQLIGCIIFLYRLKDELAIFNFSREDFRIDRAVILEHLRMGLPMGFQSSLFAVGRVVTQMAMNKLGVIDIAAVTVSQRFDSMAFMVIMSFASVIAVFNAQNYGAKRFDRILEGVKKCVVITCFVSLLISAFNVAFGAEILKLLLNNSNAQVLEQGTFYIMVNSLFYWLFALVAVFRMALQGLGRNKAPMIASSTELVVRLLVALFLIDQVGFIGICFSNALTFFAASIPLIAAVAAERRKIRELLGETDAEESAVAQLELSK
ncbi:MAG: MATE family efflux transporter [Selenomonadaceae bacterium]|nr:MATE family efflux transporter [Selenomonadaceae bacterium]